MSNVLRSKTAGAAWSSLPGRRGSAPLLIAILALFACTSGARAGETDQYITWSVELKDSAPILNRYLNEEVARFIEMRNKRSVQIKTPEAITQAFYGYLFEGLHKSRERRFMFTSPEVDRYPPDNVSFWQFQRMSIYRDFAFPFVLPMARTVRLGEVYLGIDKLDHFLGFGRRYYSQYLRVRSQGQSEDEAVATVIKRGIFLESSMVGGVVDGIISYGDLESNYQGMCMARQLASGTPPCFVRENGQWRFEGSIDVLPYITPDMDESWNPSLYTGLRRKQVKRRLEATYCAQRDAPIISERFARYAAFPKSRCHEMIQKFFEENGGDPRDEQRLGAICQDASANAGAK